MSTSDDQLDTAIETANQLHRSALRLFRLLRATRPAIGLSFSRLGVLGRLYRHGESTATGLAAHLRIQPQSMTRLIADLERRRLITRRADDADRRQSLLGITDQGAQLLTEDIRDQRVKLAQIIVEALTPAEQEMLRLAAGLMDRLAEVTEAQTAPPGKVKQDGEPVWRESDPDARQGGGSFR